MAKILGITGGIGSGKSSVSRLLSCYCLAPLIDLDQCCRGLLDLGEPGWQALHAVYGTLYQHPDGTVHRRKLREAIFNDANLRQEVDALLHPLTLACMQSAIQSHTMRPEVSLVLIEIPLLFEAGWQTQVDEILVVYARRAVQYCRLMRRDQVSRKEARQALAAQMDLAEKARRADYVIENSGSWACTRGDVVALGNRLCSMLQRQF